MSRLSKQDRGALLQVSFRGEYDDISKDCFECSGLSVEQLWLMYVMYENYNKKWDKEKGDWHV